MTAKYSENILKRQYRLQAWSNIDGWQDTRFASVYLPEVEREYVKLASDSTRWIGGNIGKLRIVMELA